MAQYDKEAVLKFHQGGKVSVRLPKPLKTKEDLCLAYTPGVAQAVKEIAANPTGVYEVTSKSNLVAVVSDGKLNFVVSCGKDAVASGAHAGKLAMAVASVTGGKGGGRPDSAVAGGRDISKIDDALAEAEKFLA